MPFILFLRKLQRFFGLEPTGINDEATKKLLFKPRCGVPDILDSAMTSGIFIYQPLQKGLFYASILY